MPKRALTIFSITFVVVLMAGIALAQVGSFVPRVTDTTVLLYGDGGEGTETPKEEPVEKPAEEPAEEPKEDPVEEPKEEPTDKPKEEPVDEPKEEPKEEPVEEPKEEPAEEPKDTEAPVVEILHPADGQVFEEKTVVFEGVVDDPTAKVYAGPYEADVNDDGGWRIVLLLNKGQNVATISAVDEAGNEGFDKVTVHFDPPVEEPKEEPKEDPKEEPADWPFKAHQKFGSCGEEVPYDIFYGKGVPGTTVWVESKYGSGSTKVGEGGHWEIKVEFPEAPAGKTFEVVVEGEGGRKVFTFKNTGSGGEH